MPDDGLSSPIVAERHGAFMGGNVMKGPEKTCISTVIAPGEELIRNMKGVRGEEFEFAVERKASKVVLKDRDELAVEWTFTSPDAVTLFIAVMERTLVELKDAADAVFGHRTEKAAAGVKRPAAPGKKRAPRWKSTKPAAAEKKASFTIGKKELCSLHKPKKKVPAKGTKPSRIPDVGHVLDGQPAAPKPPKKKPKLMPPCV
jgi:hypothetical protein